MAAAGEADLLDDELVLYLRQVQLEVIADELLPPVLKVEEDVLADVLLTRLLPGGTAARVGCRGLLGLARLVRVGASRRG